MLCSATFSSKDHCANTQSEHVNEQMNGPTHERVPAAATLPGKTEVTALEALVYLQKTILNLLLDHLPFSIRSVQPYSYIKYTVNNWNPFMMKQEENATLLCNSMAYK